MHRHHHAIRVFGTKGLFLCDDQSARYSWVRDPGDDVEVVALPLAPASKGALIPRFVDDVLRGAPDEGALDQELIVAAAIIAVDESLRRGDLVELPVPARRRERASARGLYWAR